MRDHFLLERSLMLSAQSAAVVRATAVVVAEHAEEITACFYPRMFAAHPELLDLFNQGNQANGQQRKALAGAVVRFAVSLVDPDAPDVDPVLERIAHKHLSLGITPEQYTVVGRYLLGAVAEVLGDAVTPAVAAAWDEVYWLFAVRLIAREAALYRDLGVDPTRPWRPWRVLGRTPEATGTVSLVLAPADGLPALESLPGQYVSVLAELPDGGRQPRQYSISSRPGPDQVQITVRRVPGAEGTPDGQVSGHLHDRVEVGDVLLVGPPAGDVVLLPGDSPLALISAGVGITPIAGMVEHLARTEPDRPVTLVHADRNPGSHALRGAVAEAAARLDRADVHVWYERGADTVRPVAGERVHAGLVDLAEVDLPDGVEAVLCGPLPFMAAVRAQLLHRGVPSQRIRYEVFGPDLWAGTPAPPS